MYRLWGILGAMRGSREILKRVPSMGVNRFLSLLIRVWD